MDDDAPLPDFRAALDQVGAALLDLAPTFAGYFRALVDAGMPEDAALQMVMGMQVILSGCAGLGDE